MWKGRIDELPRPARIALWGLGGLLALLFLRRSLGYFVNPYYLELGILIEMLLVALWHFEAVFLPLFLLAFLWAGADPGLISFRFMAARWVVLAVGALAGTVLWMRDRQRAFTAIHLVALSCVAAASVSALVSEFPMVALLKVLSLFLLFLYGSTGARVALAGRETRLVRGLLLGCEGLTFISGAGELAGFSMFGNPNSLGAIMGVAMTPVLLWGFLVAKTRSERYRRAVALLTCGVLLLSSHSRASLLAGAVAVVLLCFCLGRTRLLMQLAFISALLLAIDAVVRPAKFEQFVSDTTTDIVYKGPRDQGFLSSRKTPWEQTVAEVKQHPWFGSGFGTSNVAIATTRMSLGFSNVTTEGRAREHGNSYLALAEYMGLLGVVPFAFLLFLVARMVVQMCLWTRRTSNPHHPGIPMAMVLASGLVHAFFEDWLFAVGYYLCVFFWILAFQLRDIVPTPASVSVPAASPAHPRILQPLSAPLAPRQ